MKKLQLLCMAVIIICSQSVLAASVPWSQSSYSHFSKNEDLRDVLRDLAIGSGLSISISEQVKGEVNGTFKDLNYEDSFDVLSRMFGLTSYFDGSVLWIYMLEEVESATIKLNSISVDKFERKLNELDVLDPDLSWRALKHDQIIYITGPSRYVELVSELASELDVQKEKQAGKIYTHVDKEGVMHFSDQPLPKMASSEVKSVSR